MFQQIDEYAPGFQKSIIGYEVLTPPDLESIFGLTGGVRQSNYIIMRIPKGFIKSDFE